MKFTCHLSHEWTHIHLSGMFKIFCHAMYLIRTQWIIFTASFLMLFWLWLFNHHRGYPDGGRIYARVIWFIIGGWKIWGPCLWSAVMLFKSWIQLLYFQRRRQRPFFINLNWGRLMEHWDGSQVFFRSISGESMVGTFLSQLTD